MPPPQQQKKPNNQNFEAKKAWNLQMSHSFKRKHIFILLISKRQILESILKLLHTNLFH